MINQIRRLTGHLTRVACNAGKRGFDTFLSDLLGDALDAFVQQSGGVAFRRVGIRAFDEPPFESPRRSFPVRCCGWLRAVRYIV